MVSLRFLLSLLLLHLAMGVSPAATPKEINNAIQLGAGYLKDQYKNATPKQILNAPNGVGAAALAGLALLECDTQQTDASIRAITSVVRDSSFTVTQTYHIALCILYLDKLADPTDVPLIQLLGARLLAGQDANGGWGYECIESVPLLEERELRKSLLTSSVPGKSGGASKLFPEVVKYQERLGNVRIRSRIADNSNTQFGVLGLWVARKHGLPCEAAFNLIEKRFLSTQTNNGGWPYVGTNPGSPSMTCAGLLGLAVAIGGREEQSVQPEAAKPGLNPKGDANNQPKPPADASSKAVEKGLSALASSIAGNARGKGPRMLVNGAGLGDHDLYFLWSVERVGVLFGMEKIGGIDWYDVGAEELVAAQNISGSWGRGGRGAEVDTAFAILFLVRSNPIKDLSTRLQKDLATTTELRTGSTSKSSDKTPPTVGAKPTPPAEHQESRRPGVIVIRPNSQTEDSKTLAAELVGAQGLEWDTQLTKARDANASIYTQALVIAISRLDGDRLKQARETLAERLTRMTSETLRTSAKSENAELRRAAVLAMSLKNDKKHIPDLIDAILDEEEMVVRTARTGLKSLTDQDFGPQPGATSAERKAVASAWREWLLKQKK